MNPAYTNARFRATLPGGERPALPESFFIITAWNPNGTPQDNCENEKAGLELLSAIQAAGKDHFPVTGYDDHSPHFEDGLGIVTTRDKALALGRQFHQEAVFQVHRGQVSLLDCASDATPRPLRPWAEMADSDSQPQVHSRGPFALLKELSTATAFFCSTVCPGDPILAAYKWARKQCDASHTIISGFHTPVEKDVLAILARRGANIIQVPARDLPTREPKELQKAIDEERLLTLSPFPYHKPARATRASSSQRNRFIASLTADHHIPYLSKDSSLAQDLNL